MDRDTAVERVQETLGFTTAHTTKIISRLQDAQVDLEKGMTLPWFLRTEISSISTVAAEERVKLPSDFLRQWEEDPLWYYNADAEETADVWKALIKEELETLRNDLPGTGSPQAYSLDDSYFRIFPTPDAAYVLKMIYYKADALLTTNVENLWLEHFPWLLIGIAGAPLAAGLRDKEAVSVFAALEAKHHAKMVVDTEARIHAGRRYVMGGPD